MFRYYMILSKAIPLYGYIVTVLSYDNIVKIVALRAGD